MSDLLARRSFLRAAAAAGAAWAAADLLQVEEALAWALDQKRKPASGLHRVDGGAGERRGCDAVAHPSIRRGTAWCTRGRGRAFHRQVAGDVQSGTETVVCGGDSEPAIGDAAVPAGFASLTAAQQDDLLQHVERTPFFQAIRFDTIVGMFALPSWGGNRDYRSGGTCSASSISPSSSRRSASTTPRRMRGVDVRSARAGRRFSAERPRRFRHRRLRRRRRHSRQGAVVGRVLRRRPRAGAAADRRPTSITTSSGRSIR